MNNSNYWDIDDIISEEQKVNIKFIQDSKYNGFLDTSRTCVEGDDIPQNAELELPFWIALELASTKNNNNEYIAEIEIPIYYRERYQNTLTADPTVANLKEKNQYFYEFGVKIAKLFALLSQHQKIEDCASLIKKMTNLELAIFNQGREMGMKYRSYKEVGNKSTHYQYARNKLKKFKVN